MTALVDLDVQVQAAAIARGELSPVELMTATLERIEQLEPEIGAYVTVVAERALVQARAAEAELAAGRSRGPLHGIPYALKDLIATRGIRTTGRLARARELGAR